MTVGIAPTVAMIARTLAVRARVAVRREALTHALAGGADPASSHELQALADRLTSDRSREQLARVLRRTIAEARRPTLSHRRAGMAPVIIQRGAALDAEGAFETMIARLRRPEPVCVRGVAMAYEILCLALTSPLYRPADPGALRRRMLAAIAALDTGDASSHDFPLAA